MATAAALMNDTDDEDGERSDDDCNFGDGGNDSDGAAKRWHSEADGDGDGNCEHGEDYEDDGDDSGIDDDPDDEDDDSGDDGRGDINIRNDSDDGKAMA